MIFVTVGTLPFDRLIRKIDEIAPNIDKEFIMQIGKSSYRPINTKYFQFTKNFSEIDYLIRSSELVIAHGGIGSIIKILENKKPSIVVPRNKRYDKVIDDHQLEIIDFLSSQKKIIKITDLNKIYDTIENIRIGDLNIFADNSLILYLKNIIENMDAKNDQD